MVMAAMDEAVDWAGGLDALVEQIAPRFRRIEPRRRVRAYLEGLLAPVERKNGWQLAENAGDRTPDGMQDFLPRMRWDADQLRDDLKLPRFGGRFRGWRTVALFASAVRSKGASDTPRRSAAGWDCSSLDEAEAGDACR